MKLLTETIYNIHNPKSEWYHSPRRIHPLANYKMNVRVDDSYFTEHIQAFRICEAVSFWCKNSTNLPSFEHQINHYE